MLRAFAIATSTARDTTRWPMPLSPSTTAVPSRSCTTRMSGRRLMPALHAPLGPNIPQQELKKPLRHSGFSLIVPSMRLNMPH